MSLEGREQQLLDLMAELADFLDRYDVTHWAEHFRDCREKLGYLIQEDAPREEKAEAAAMIRSAYGGMGSFNDLIICRTNKHPIEESEEKAVNAELQRQSEAVWEASWLYQERPPDQAPIVAGDGEAGGRRLSKRERWAVVVIGLITLCAVGITLYYAGPARWRLWNQLAIAVMAAYVVICVLLFRTIPPWLDVEPSGGKAHLRWWVPVLVILAAIAIIAAITMFFAR